MVRVWEQPLVRPNQLAQAMGWRRMSMRGLDKAQGEWSLVAMAWNVKRLHVLRAA